MADTLDYYQNWYINPDQTRDSIYERVISNRFFVQAQPWDRNGVVGTIDAGIGIDMHTYSQFEMRDYQTGKYTKVNKTSYFAYGSVGGKIKKYVDWDANLKFYPSGYRGGDLTIGAHLALTGVPPRTPPDSRRPVHDGSAFAQLLAGESVLEPLRVVHSFE